MGLELTAEHLPGVCAGERPCHVDPFTHLAVVHPRPHRSDDPGAVNPRGIGEREVGAVGAGADIGVHRVHPGRPDFDHHLTRFRFCVGQLHNPHHLGLAELMDPYRSHDILLYPESKS